MSTMTLSDVSADLRRLGYHGYADAIDAHLARQSEGVSEARYTETPPTESGWYWHWDGECHRMHFVFNRPGHAYLCTEGEPYGAGQKRNFQAVQRMGGKWSTKVEPPALTAVWHNRPALAALCERNPAPDASVPLVPTSATEVFVGPAQEKAEPVGLADSMVAMRDSVGSLCDKLQDRIKEVAAPPAEPVRADADGMAFVDGMGWVIQCSRAAEYVARLLSAAPEASHYPTKNHDHEE